MSVTLTQSNKSFCCLSLRTGAVSIIGYYSLSSLLNLFHDYEPSNFVLYTVGGLLYSSYDFGFSILLVVCVTGLIGCYQRSHTWMNISSKAFLSYAILWSVYTSVVSGMQLTGMFTEKFKNDMKESLVHRKPNSTETFDPYTPEEKDELLNAMANVSVFAFCFWKFLTHSTKAYFAYVLHQYTRLLRPKLEILQRGEKTIIPQ